MDHYKFAAQNKLRFPSARGQLSVENLFELPLKSATNIDLDTVARGISAELKGMDEESFVENASNPRKATLEVSLELVKDVIKTKQEANQRELTRRQRAAERQKILDIIGTKKDEQLGAASLEELEKRAAALAD